MIPKRKEDQTARPGRASVLGSHAEQTPLALLARALVALRGGDTRGDVNHLASLACVGAGLFKSESWGRWVIGGEGTIRRYYPKLQTFCIKQAGSSPAARPWPEHVPAALHSCLPGSPPSAGGQGSVPDLLSPPAPQAIGEGSAVPPETWVGGE